MATTRPRARRAAARSAAGCSAGDRSSSCSRSSPARPRRTTTTSAPAGSAPPPTPRPTAPPRPGAHPAARPDAASRRPAGARRPTRRRLSVRRTLGAGAAPTRTSADLARRRRPAHAVHRSSTTAAARRCRPRPSSCSRPRPPSRPSAPTAPSRPGSSADGRSRLTLVGGGDPFLAGKRPTDPAAEPRREPPDAGRRDGAAALKARGVTHGLARLRHLAVHRAERQPALAAELRPRRRGLTDHRRSGSTRAIAPTARREADPAASAADAVRGVPATSRRRRHADRSTSTRRPAAAREVARVTSLPLADIVERVLQVSDNEGAEVLARQTGLAVNGHGLVRRRRGGGAAGPGRPRYRPATARQIYDGSGLSRDDRLGAETLVSVLQLAASGDHPELRVRRHRPPGRGVRRLPRGPLRRRSPGRGWVRAKTGTLRGTSALAGLVTDARGRPLVFAFVSNHIPLGAPRRSCRPRRPGRDPATCRC